MKVLIFFCLMLPIPSEASIFGEENIPLMKLVIGQIAELEKLSEALGVAKENRDLLLSINEGIESVTKTLESLDEIVSRSKRLNPSSIRKISEITNLVNDAKSLAKDLDLITDAKLALTDEAILSSSLQAETSYSIGGEMIKTGSNFSNESKSASPGRAAQIAAAASSAQMVGTGALLQNIAHLTQLQALELEYRKSEVATSRKMEEARKKAASDFLQRRKR